MSRFSLYVRFCKKRVFTLIKNPQIYTLKKLEYALYTAFYNTPIPVMCGGDKHYSIETRSSLTIEWCWK